MTWTISLLPFIEQQSLFDQYNCGLPNEHASNREVVQSFIGTYLCPSDIKTNELAFPRSGPGSHSEWAPGSYRAVSGATDAPNGDWYFDNGSIPPQMPRQWRGALHVVRPTTGLTTERLAAIVDGTTHTMLVGEYHTLTFNSRRTFWGYAYNSFNQSSATNQVRTMIPDFDKCVSIGGVGGMDPCKRAFGSLHPAGMNGLLADGSVRFLSLGSIDLDVWWSLATISGAEPTVP